MRLFATLDGSASNIYTIAGVGGSPLSIPPAFHTPAPFGADVGGVNPAFFAFSPTSEYDSWLTLGLDDGSQSDSISSVGIEWGGRTGWSEQYGIRTTNGAIFLMDPESGLGESPGIWTL